MSETSSRRFLPIVVGAIATLWCLSGRSAWAQARVDDQGTLTLGLDYSYGTSHGVLVRTDMPDMPVSPTTIHTGILRAEYVPIDRLALDVAVPYMVIKYTGTNRHMPVIGQWDDHKSHGTFQDGEIGARYALLTEPFQLTPSVAVSRPLQNYATNGFTDVGRHILEGHFGLSAARTFDPIAPNLFIEASYVFTLGQKYDATANTEKINQDRNDVSAALGYFLLDGKLTVAVAGNYRWSNGGIDFLKFASYTKDVMDYHDVLLDESFLYLGTDIGYAVTDRVNLGVLTRFFVTGANTRDQNVFGVNLSYSVL
jgi:hypothetical protein